ncbi:hypothetical protein KM043_014384 [Ampulex compressa]|nr:hypothetical protein KM043_014384 [Ampulex compressa]
MGKERRPRYFSFLGFTWVVRRPRHSVGPPLRRKCDDRAVGANDDNVLEGRRLIAARLLGMSRTGKRMSE